MKKGINLETHYNKLWEESSGTFREGGFQVDPLIHSSDDNRFGVTLLLRPSEPVLNSMSLFLNELKKTEPNLYYQPISDIHITVLSIISCYDGFELSMINIKEQTKLIQKSLEGLSSFTIRCKGVTASQSAVMIQGFPSDDQLGKIRDSLRENYANSDEQSRMDVRYAITTAHSTVVRFPEKPQNIQKFISVLEKYREFDFGSFEVKSLEFVFNDWYQKKEKVKRLVKLKLSC